MPNILNPTPPDQLTDPQGRPYFLWDLDMTLEELKARLEDPDPVVRGYFAGKVMRQAKPDDALQFLNAESMRVAGIPRGRFRVRDPPPSSRSSKQGGTRCCVQNAVVSS